ncbi:MAG: chromosomal replication initiator protein DnaA [Candidatus Pacebacteria bacterium]|nr:chromosomal replication initiator protein DnaA [Candidatus Paceibacterota bacterium]PIR60893.1 MAG: chromosomal replication initiator protein DnaA [Candidatus Pacebacteria bacterium CG10_big_fil_rev_8_21_14_0_10_44_54]
MESRTLSPEETSRVWQQCCAQLKKDLSAAVYNTWIVANPLTHLEYIDLSRAVANITSPTAFHSTNVKKNFHTQLTQTLSELTQRQVEISYYIGSLPQNTAGVIKTIKPGNNPSSRPILTKPEFSPSPRVEELFSPNTIESAGVDRIALKSKQIGLRTDFTFETFAVSTSNEMAHAAATAVSNQPGSSYNPLFLYGGVGVGKTHLMHAIANNILQTNPQSRMIYCTGEEFTNEIVQAIQTKRAGVFKDRYRSAQVLLIDDIQFIAGKNAVQEEFFHTFNALTKKSHQIVLTSDRPPQEIRLLEDRLRSRFEAGLMIDIQEPSFELRTAIILLKSQAQNITISIDLAKKIAETVDSARRIEGIITLIRSAVELQGRKIDLELIEQIIKTSQPLEQRGVLKKSPSEVIKTVATHFSVKQLAIKGKSRVKNLVTARHIAMYLLKTELSLPLVEIGRWFANRDHTSVLHAVKKIEAELLRDTQLQREISFIRKSLQTT